MDIKQEQRIAKICFVAEHAAELLDVLDEDDVRIAIRLMMFLLEELEAGRDGVIVAKGAREFILNEFKIREVKL